MTTRSDVLLAYRMFLGREADDMAAVDRHVASCGDLDMLRQRFLNSDEFRRKVVAKLQARPTRPPRNSPPMEVDLDVPPAKLVQLFEQTSAQWHHLGATEPHWSVLSSASFRRDRIGANEAAFFASGESDMVAFAGALGRVGLRPDPAARLLEFGCGVGRVTGHLARQVEHVVAVDISRAHLQLAEERAAAAGLANIDWRQLVSIDDVRGLGEFDYVFSVLVLQHNPPPVMVRLLGDLLARLRPGGVAFLQVAVYSVGYRFRIDEYLAGGNRTNMEMHFLPQAAMLATIDAAGCRLLELREDSAVGHPEVSISNTILVQRR